MAFSILIIDEHADEYRDRIVEAFPDQAVHAVSDRQAVPDEALDASVLIGFGPKFDNELLARMPNLEWLQFLSSGTDAVARLTALGADVVVTSTHGVHGPPVSEMALLHMMVLGRRYRMLLDNQLAERWDRGDLPLLYKKTAVIVGIGHIGGHLAHRCKAFGMTVIGVTNTPRDLPDFDAVYARADLLKAAAMADFLIVLTPLSAETRGLIGAPVFAAMKKTAYLIDMSRSGVCDNGALLAALREGRVAGAGLDVFSTEPLPKGHPFWQMPNVVVTPHMGGHGDSYIGQIMPILNTNIGRFRDGNRDEMVNIVRR